jgi:hypothetical protein
MTAYPLQPGYRAGSPETAIAAAEAIKPIAPTLEQMALDAVTVRPSTPEEIKLVIEAQTGRPVLLTSIRPRLSQLKARGLVADSGERRPGESGRCMSVAWRATTQEERALFAARQVAAAEKSGCAE